MASKTHKCTLPIWVYAKKDENGELMPPSCSLCSTSYTGKSNASNFRCHVETIYPEEYQRLNRGFTSKDQKEVNIEIMKMIVADLRPLSLLDSTRYKRTKLMFKAMNAGKTIIKRYWKTQLRKSVWRSTIGQTPLKSNLSGLQRISWMKFRQKNITIAVSEVTGAKISETVMEEIKLILDDYEISTRLQSITTDNGSNIVGACDLLQLEMPLSKFSNVQLRTQSNFKGSNGTYFWWD